jgi:hypothetical protein
MIRYSHNLVFAGILFFNPGTGFGQNWSFTNGFEGITAGGAGSGSDLDPDPAFWNYVNFWENANGDQTSIQVLNSPGPANDGSNYVRLKKFDTGTPPLPDGTYFFERAWNGNCCTASAFDLTGVSNIQEDFVWQFAFRVADASDGFRAFLGSRGTTEATTLQQTIGVGVQASNLTRFFADGEISTGVGIATGTWYTVTLDADWSTQTYDLFLNNALILTGEPFNHTFIPIRSMHIVAEADDVDLDSFFLDDFNPIDTGPPGGAGPVHFDSQGQLVVTNWLRMKEINYGNGLSYLNNSVTGAGTNWVEYENANLMMRKDFVISNDAVIVTMDVTPKNVAGENSVVETRLDFAAESRGFTHWFQPHTGANPDFTGRILAAPGAGDWTIGLTGSTGWEAGSVFIGPQGSFSFDRFFADGFTSLAAGPARVASDLSEADFPLYTRHFPEWSAAQTATDAPVRDNVFSTASNIVRYALRFYDTADADEAIRFASQDYHQARKDYWLTHHPEAAAVSTPPSPSHASFSMFAANWGGGPPDIITGNGVAGNAKGNLILYRQMLDAAGLQDFELYFWIMVYEPASGGGWGDLPTPEKPGPLGDVTYLTGLRDYLADLKANVSNLNVGLYVNLWGAWEHSQVYTLHPTWFRNRSFAADPGDLAYYGKLPEWGEHFYDSSVTPTEASIPEFIQSFGLDFVFFDSGGFVDAVSGTLEQQKTMFTNLVQSIHDAGALAMSNGMNPYMDLNYFERLSGVTADNDKWYAGSFSQTYTLPRACQPILQRLGSDYLTAVPGFFSNGWTDDPGFVPYFPCHFTDQIVVNGYQDWVDILKARKLAGTPPDIIHCAPLNGGSDFELRWNSIAATDYGIESASSLPGGFTQILTNGIAGSPPENAATIPAPGANSSSFRVFGQ